MFGTKDDVWRYDQEPLRQISCRYWKSKTIVFLKTVEIN